MTPTSTNIFPYTTLFRSILLNKTEKEYKKLPDTSNRKPRIALRLKTLEGCLKAYEPEYITLPTADVFLSRIRGEEEGFVRDRKSTRLNSSHLGISYAVFC